MRNGSTCMPGLVCRVHASDKTVPLQELQLIAGRGRPVEGGGIERRHAAVEAVLPRRNLEQRRDLLRVLALATHAAAELRVGDAAGTGLADAADHLRLPLRVVLVEPGLEERVERLRQP